MMLRKILSRITRGLPNDLIDKDIIKAVQSETMTPPEALHMMLKSVEYVVENEIEGAIVECGVWRGGTMMAVAKKLQRMNRIRPLYLYDTFDGMTAPSKNDVAVTGESGFGHFMGANSFCGDS